MTMALQLIPIQKAKVSDQRLQQLSSLQGEIRCAQFAAARAAEEQSAQLKRLMDQSKVDASKTQEMLTQVRYA
jgi:DNA-binding FadR family transcriptional regulator